ncbi:hypothetical protein M0813_14247 [Anaeramoeba flamelloides]|uniref:Uncharacterized protein n=1 Tax=Anaeramoeba flamelloides TaxID=1746091 RepID=A0ABQ8Z685_9EUKA|nr:hypothetical protein M0813_14247 [Anaeramoeba flamelloides]
MSDSGFETFSPYSDSDPLPSTGSYDKKNSENSSYEDHLLNQSSGSGMENEVDQNKKCKGKDSNKTCAEFQCPLAAVIGFLGLALGSFIIALLTMGTSINESKNSIWLIILPAVFSGLGLIVASLRKAKLEIIIFTLVTIFFIGCSLVWKYEFWNTSDFEKSTGVIIFGVFLIILLILLTVLLFATLVVNQPLFGTILSLNTGIFFLIFRVFSGTHNLLVGNILLLTTLLSLYLMAATFFNKLAGKEILKIGNPVVVCKKCKKCEK